MELKRIEKLMLSLLAATLDGKLSWRETEIDGYVPETNGQSIIIEFEHPLVAEETFPEADKVKVTIARLATTFFSGTEGADIAGRILAAGLPKWEEHQTSIDQIVNEADALLESLVRS